MTQSVEKKEVSAESPLRGLKVCMVAPYRPKTGGVTFQTHMQVDGLESEGVTVVRVDTILHKLNYPALKYIRLPLQALFTAVRFLRNAPRCDVVHIQACSWWGFLPAYVCVPLNKLFVKKRLVISFHGAEGHIWIKKLRPIVVPILHGADVVVVVSPALKEAFAEYGVKSDVLWNLVDFKRFQFRERPVIKPNILWIRRFTPHYDPMAALKVFAKVKAEIPEASITFVGDGGGLRTEMDKFIEDSRLTDVIYTGWVSDQRVSEEFNKADIFINTSHNDGLPTTLLEASAAGLPIVSTNPGGIPQMLIDGKEGLLAPVGDIDTLANHIIGLIRDPERAHQMGLAARKNAERYSWDRCAKDLAIHYKVA